MSYLKASLYGAAGFASSLGSILSQLTTVFQGSPGYWNSMAVVFFVISVIELAHEQHEVEA